MGENTKIEWAHHTWSPWIGCQKTGSLACDHCYAEAMMDTRLHQVEWGPHGERKLTSDAYWRQPLRWEREAAASGEQVRVFPSLCDPFDNKAPKGARARFADLIRATPHLTWLLLTKRIGNATAMLAEMFAEGVPPNVWLGATVVTQQEADRDVPKLLTTLAAKWFLSMEPLMESVCLDLDWLIGTRKTPALDWVIVGGESGPSARAMRSGWVRSLRDQCAASGVYFLMKQWGEWLPFDQREAFQFRNSVSLQDNGWAWRVGKSRAGRLLDGVQHDGVPA